MNDPMGPSGVQFEEVSFRYTATTSPGKDVPANELLWYTGLGNGGVAFGVGKGGDAFVRVPPPIPLGDRALVTTRFQLEGKAAVEPMMICPKLSGTAVDPGAGYTKALVVPDGGEHVGPGVGIVLPPLLQAASVPAMSAAEIKTRRCFMSAAIREGLGKAWVPGAKPGRG